MAVPNPVDLDLSQLESSTENDASTPILSKASQKKNSNEPKAPRQRNYSEAEDLQLCTSWLEITQDPIIGVNQTDDGFWIRVTEKYMKALPDPICTSIGLKSRWGVLQGAINKFAGCVRQVTNANQSGTTAQDQLTYALRLYTELYKKLFAHIACYDLLSNAPKWNEYCYTLEQKQKSDSNKQKRAPSPTSDNVSTQSGPVPSSEAGDTAEPPSDTISVTESSNDPDRPIGNKRAKLAHRNELWKSNLAQSHQMMAEQTQRQNQLLESQTKSMESLAEDSRAMVKDSFMSKDLSNLDDRVKKYYEMKRSKIFEQYNIQ